MQVWENFRAFMHTNLRVSQTNQHCSRGEVVRALGKYDNMYAFVKIAKYLILWKVNNCFGIHVYTHSMYICNVFIHDLLT